MLYYNVLSFIFSFFSSNFFLFRDREKHTSFLAPPALKTLEPAAKFTEGKLKPVKPEKPEPVLEEENAEEVPNGLLVRVGKEEEAAWENDVGKFGLCYKY